MHPDVHCTGGGGTGSRHASPRPRPYQRGSGQDPIRLFPSQPGPPSSLTEKLTVDYFPFPPIFFSPSFASRPLAQQPSVSSADQCPPQVSSMPTRRFPSKQPSSPADSCVLLFRPSSTSSAPLHELFRTRRLAEPQFSEADAPRLPHLRRASHPLTNSPSPMSKDQ